ncbi:MAG: trypsin-like peptidase domain-containing protein [Flavobacteriales bacterium]|nr:trypsin-like peptidase domain-containing protein [Flavobacteriales bacterium]
MNYKNVFIVIIISILSSFATVLVVSEKDSDSALVSRNIKEAPVSFVSSNYGKVSPSNFSKAAESTVNSVVHVTSIIGSTRSGAGNDFSWGGSRQKSQPIVGSGSGVIITKDGYIVTNNHVIDKAESLEVTLNNQRTYKAVIIGKDPKTDIALLKIDADDLPSIILSNSDNIRLGEWVIAVGNPFNLTSTVTAGIVSAIGRDIHLLGKSGIESFIQTDAVVNPGNSGGALVNTDGDLIGINTAISTHTGSFEGYSFAVPSNIVKKVVEDLIEYGQVQRAYLGINIQELNSEAANRLDISETEGIYISGFSESGFASESGLDIGDVINRLDNKKIKTFADLRGYLASKRPGDIVKVGVLSDGNKEEHEVKLTNSFGTTELNKFENKDVFEMLNAKFVPLSDSQKYRIGVKAGVVVKDVGEGLLQKAGIGDGYIILRVQNQWIRNGEDLKAILLSSEKAVLMEVVDRNGYVDYYAVKK